MKNCKRLFASFLAMFMLAFVVAATVPATTTKVEAKTYTATLKKTWSGYTTNGMPTFIEKGCKVTVLNMNSISAYYCRYTPSVGGDYCYVYIPPTYLKMS